MIKRTRSLPLNTIILAIIAIVVLVFLIGKIILPTPPRHPILPYRIFLEQCSEYISALPEEVENSTNSSAQLQILANSQYVSWGCSISIPFGFSLYNGSGVICGLGQKVCINLKGSGCSSCQPPGCIPGCQLK